MKKLLFGLLFLNLFLLVGCNNTNNNEDTEIEEDTTSDTDSTETTDDGDVLTGLNEFSLDYDSFKTNYGDFSLTKDDEEVEGVDGIYTINVSSSKQEFYLEGYLEGKIVINNANKLDSYKGVILYLSNTFLKYDDSPVIDYLIDSKNVQIINVANTTNYIVNTSETNYDGHGIYSANNLEMTLLTGSNLYIYTAHGHTIKADGDVKIKGAGNIYLSSGHDAVHCHNFTTTNSGTLSGTFTILNAISQGIEASVKDSTATLSITGGTFIIDNCESVLKVDATINITGGSLTATNIWSDPFVRGGSTTLSLNIGDGITVLVNGTSYQSTTI